MLSIRETISRIARSVRSVEANKYTKPVEHRVKGPSNGTYNRPKVVHKKDANADMKDLDKYTPLLSNFQSKIYRDFLSPLDIPNLKIFNDDLPEYNNVTARSNWKKKQNGRPINVFNNFLQDRVLFEKMMDFLINITPEHLKDTNLENTLSINHILQQEEVESNVNRFPGLYPKNSFTEIPPIPSPLTNQSFQEYIYILTHSNFYYRNSSSLVSGLVPDILLYTHKLTNEEFKPYRSVHTYNYLIKFFGFDKNQSSFARELLLVMNKDGHKPNIDTINHLLKLCQIHSHIRTNTNTYQVIMKYLKLCQSLNIDINLSTYNRIYDSINNIFLKESFLNRIQAVKLPVSKNLLIKILDDFLKTTKDSNEVIQFIETDLDHKSWHTDSKILNKVIYHRGLHVRNEQDVDNLWTFIVERGLQIDEFTLKVVLEALWKNSSVAIENSNKGFLMLAVYVNLMSKLSNIGPVDVSSGVRAYRFLIQGLVRESDKSPQLLSLVAFLVRGVIYEATQELNLPVEVTEYSNNNVSISENYKIIRRIVGEKLESLEAKIEYYNKENAKQGTGLAISHPKEILSESEASMWSNIKSSLLVGEKRLLSNANEEVDKIIHAATIEIPPEAISQYQQLQKRKYTYSRNRDRLYKLKEGYDNYTRRRMQERNIL
ncbi:uncharacterized protein RJT20DRAFT_123135 [Scheffersomyces xylosifermentans]|uniref:uncharacterized protein n=1 Tax=Scheffersomyces xylosifermentans TaxID=1304137 RepID=UPI00315DB17A